MVLASCGKLQMTTSTGALVRGRETVKEHNGRNAGVRLRENSQRSTAKNLYRRENQANEKGEEMERKKRDWDYLKVQRSRREDPWGAHREWILEEHTWLGGGGQKSLLTA